ncbi:hypothetical protein ACQJBY_036378 [Aegilops geniculata]
MASSPSYLAHHGGPPPPAARHHRSQQRRGEKINVNLTALFMYEFRRPGSSTSVISQRSISRRRPRRLMPAPGIAGGPTYSSTAPVHSPSSLSMHSFGSPASQYTVAGGAAPSSQLLNGLQRREIARSSTCRTMHVHVPAPPSQLQ